MATAKLHDLDGVIDPIERARLARENVRIALANLRVALGALGAAIQAERGRRAESVHRLEAELADLEAVYAQLGGDDGTDAPPA